MPAGPAMATLRSVVAYLAVMLRCSGMVYTVVQVLTWQSFFAAAWWRLAVPVMAAAWAATIAVVLRKGWASPLLACVDSAVYVGLALGAQMCVPPGVRDGGFSWLVISMSGQLIFSVWYAPRALFAPLAFAPSVAYWAGAMTQPVTDRPTLVEATILLALVGGIHAYGRRQFYARATEADAALETADRAASEQYAILSRAIERREHERLLHDTVLNTLTAVTRVGDDNAADVVNRCRQDVALIETTLSGGIIDRPADLRPEIQAAVAVMRSRGLSIHVEIGDGEAPKVPARVATALSNAMREALSNVSAHAGTGEAWVEVRFLTPREGMTPPEDADGPSRLEVTIRDEGAGFDPAHVSGSRLGLKRSVKERVADCGGRASIWSKPGQGTVVRLSWPASGWPGEPGRVGRDEADSMLARESLPW